MTYLVIQILSLLTVATLIGLAIGWLFRAISASRREKGLKAKIDSSDREIPSLKNALFQADAATQEQERTISALREKLNDRNNALNNAEITQKEIEQQRDDIENQVDSVNAELKKAWELADCNEQRVFALQGEMESERDRLRSELRGRVEALETADAKSAGLAAEIERLKDANNSKSDTIDTLNNDLVNAENERWALENEIERLKLALENAEQEMKDRIAELSRELDREKAALSNAREAAARSEAKLESLNAQLKDRANELARLEEQTKNQYETIDHLQRQYNLAQQGQATSDSENANRIISLEKDLDAYKKQVDKAEQKAVN